MDKSATFDNEETLLPLAKSGGQRQVPLVRRNEITNVGAPVKPVGQCARLYLCRHCPCAHLCPTSLL